MRFKGVLSILALAALICLTGVCTAAESMVKKGEAVTMQGTLSCGFCTLVDPEHAMNKKCCQGCLKSGDSVLLKSDKGELYLLIAGEHEKTLKTSEVIEMAGEQVQVKGNLVKNGGLQGIYVEKIDKAPAAKEAGKPGEAAAKPDTEKKKE